MPLEINSLEDALLLFADLVSLAPLVIFLTLLYNFIILPNKNILDLVLFIYLMLAGFIVRFLKDLPYPKSWRWITDRPLGAGNCDYFSRNGLCKPGTPGMPSGHMTHTTIFAVVMILGRYFSAKGRKINIENILFYGINVALIVVMAFARYYKKCHNIPQIIAGFILGSVLGYLFYHLMNIFFLEKNKNQDILGKAKFLKTLF